MNIKIILTSIDPAEIFLFRSVEDAKEFLDKTPDAPDTVQVFDEQGDNVARLRRQRNGKFERS